MRGLSLDGKLSSLSFSDSENEDLPEGFGASSGTMVGVPLRMEALHLDTSEAMTPISKSLQLSIGRLVSAVGVIHHYSTPSRR